MGVKGLFQFLKRFEKEVTIPHFVAGKSVGIDIFWFIHQSKGDIFSLQNYLLPIIKNAREVHCVFDGIPPEEKQKELNNLKQSQQELIDTIQKIENFIKYPFNRLTSEDRKHINVYLQQLRRQVWYPSYNYVDKVKCWLESKRCYIYQAPEEADTILIKLEQKNIISTIFTNDSDLLVLGSSSVIRIQSPLRGALFDSIHICKILGLTAVQWNDFMYLCKHMEEKDILLAYSLISVYKDIEYVIEKYFIHYKKNLINYYELENTLE